MPNVTNKTLQDILHDELHFLLKVTFIRWLFGFPFYNWEMWTQQAIGSELQS